MRRAVICSLVLTLAVPAAADASFRRAPAPPPPPRYETPDDYARGDWDTRPQDAWDRQLRNCLNDRRQTRREKRNCADSGMPVRKNRRR